MSSELVSLEASTLTDTAITHSFHLIPGLCILYAMTEANTVQNSGKVCVGVERKNTQEIFISL